MKCTVEKGLLLQHLQKVISIVNKKTTLPILGNVMLTAENDELKLTTTNLEIRIETTLKASGIDKEGFVTTLPAHSLLAIVSNCQGTEITIECAKNFHCTITSGNAKFKLLGLDPIDFPEGKVCEAKNRVCIKSSVFEKLINHVFYAISKDDSRKMLQGIHLNFEGQNASAVATDGKRLAISTGANESIQGDKKELIIPAKAALELKKIFAGVDECAAIEYDDKSISAECGTTKLTAKLLDGTYPNYQQIIPKEFAHTIEIGTSVLLASLDLITLPMNSNPETGSIVLKLTAGKMTLSMSSSMLGEGEDSFDITYDGEDIQMQFNPVFLAEPLKNMGTATLQFRFNDANTPISIENDCGFQYILMPLRQK